MQSIINIKHTNNKLIFRSSWQSSWADVQLFPINNKRWLVSLWIWSVLCTDGKQHWDEEVSFTVTQRNDWWIYFWWTDFVYIASNWVQCKSL